MNRTIVIAAISSLALPAGFTALTLMQRALSSGHPATFAMMGRQVQALDLAIWIDAIWLAFVVAIALARRRRA